MNRDVGSILVSDHAQAKTQAKPNEMPKDHRIVMRDGQQRHENQSRAQRHRECGEKSGPGENAQEASGGEDDITDDFVSQSPKRTINGCWVRCAREKTRKGITRASEACGKKQVSVCLWRR